MVLFGEVVGRKNLMFKEKLVLSGKPLQFAIENGPVEIVGFPSYKIVIFQSFSTKNYDFP